MKHRISLSGILLLLTLMTLSGTAISASTLNAADAPKDDEEIRTCITDAFAKGRSLKEQKLTVAVSDGVVTISGTAKNQGSKGAASRIAKKCGAKEVKNEAAVENPTRPKKKEPASPDRQ